MSQLITDPGIDARKQWFALTDQQRFNVRQRMNALRMKMPRQLFLLAIQEVMRLELTPGRPAPPPCAPTAPVISQRDAVAAVCLMAPAPKP